MKFCVCFVVFLIGIGALRSSDVRSSLTFVIDHSYSMHDDIEQVRINADALFDTVMNANSSQIEDFVLVGFSDPAVALRSATKDRKTFKNALRGVEPDDDPNGDCPEMAMSGIELALKSSREASFLYVFTDASAKDYEKLDEVIALGQKMQSQVVFVLTGDCDDRRSNEYLSFHRLARATNGQVFHMEKREIGEILNYVKNTIESRRHMIASKTYPAGYGNHFNVNVDGDTKELMISVSGLNPSVGLTDSKGADMPTADVTKLREVAIVQVRGVKPGVYRIEVGSESKTNVVVSGSTTVHFQHGFSVFEPTAITETAKKPVPGEKSHVSIKLSTEGGKVELQSMQIRDMDDNVMLEKPLRLLDEAEQFYTTDPIVPPNHLFRIAIKGYHKDTRTFITRLSLTSIQPQDSPKAAVPEKAPEVSIDGGDKIVAKYKEVLKLKCKVSGYPKPDIIWESDDPTAELSHIESVVELPYEFISFLLINKVKKSSTYTCKAVNKLGTESKNIAVKLNFYFDVLEEPTDTVIEYKRPGQLFCKVSAFPPATVYWYKDHKPLVTDSNAELSADNSTLTIRSMEPYVAGNYICEIRNDFHRKIIPFTVSTNVEKPKINKNSYYIEALKYSSVNITCDLFRGKPTPTFTWFYAEENSPLKFTELEETAATLRVRDVGPEHGGRYRCVARNVVGRDYHDIDLIVEYPPSWSRLTSARVAASEGDAVTLPCPADGAPPPDFTWRRDGADLPPENYTLFRDGSLRFTASLTDSGNYECEARNDHGAIRTNVKVDINVPVYIEPPKRSRVLAMVGESVALPCRADGLPAPRLEWLFHSLDPGDEPKHYTPSDSSGSLYFERIQPAQGGFYTCIASNVAGSYNITYTVSVLAPPSISYSARQFTGVMGDVLLRIPCNAAGNPKPNITWTKNGYAIPLDSPWYTAEGDGSLLLKDVDARAAGAYECRAANSLGAVAEVFDAIVKPSPAAARPGAPVWLQEGQSAAVACDVPRRNTDRLRWFKDGRKISNGELLLKNVSRQDAGLYTCRVSSFADAQTASTQVEVGSKPRFTFNDEKNIEFEVGDIAVMSCDNTGEPKPEVRWLHDDEPLDVAGSTHEVVMTSPRDKGRYTCIVSNSFGSVQQEFEISSYECVLDIKKDFDGNAPLILTRFLDLNQFDTSDGHVHIKRGDTLALVCPAEFNKVSRRLITVECVNGKQFAYDGRRFSYSDLKCREKINPVIKRTGRRCTDGDSEMMSVGFQIPGRFMEVYQVCLDRATKTTIYTYQNITLSQANVVPEYDIKWFNSGSAVDLDRLYDCGYQNNRISSTLRKGFHTSDACCFARRQLVSPRDVAPGLPQAATYTHLNVAPHWGTCNSQNWEEVEERVRGLARAARRALPVWGGAAGALALRDAAAAPRNVSLSDGRADYRVPEFIWKVVQDPWSDAALAVVQVNVPDLRLQDAGRYRLCRDVCAEIDWMRNRRWRDPRRGYTYCCRLPEFESAFRLRGAFPPRRNLLKAASYLADSSALHL